MKTSILSLSLLMSLAGASALAVPYEPSLAILRCVPQGTLRPGAYLVSVDQVLTRPRSVTLAAISRMTNTGPRLVAKLPVTRLNPKAIGGPVLFTGKDFVLAVNATTTPLPGGGHASTLQADTREGRIAETLSCSFVR